MSGEVIVAAASRRYPNAARRGCRLRLRPPAGTTRSCGVTRRSPVVKIGLLRVRRVRRGTAHAEETPPPRSTRCLTKLGGLGPGGGVAHETVRAASGSEGVYGMRVEGKAAAAAEATVRGSLRRPSAVKPTSVNGRLTPSIAGSLKTMATARRRPTTFAPGVARLDAHRHASSPGLPFGVPAAGAAIERDRVTAASARFGGRERFVAVADVRAVERTNRSTSRGSAETSARHFP